jgi:hypothetical protein
MSDKSQVGQPESSALNGLTEISPHAATPQLPEPSPVIVIEYRRSLFTRLAPPVMILAVALAITLYEHSRPRRHLTARPPASPRATKPAAPPAPEEKILARAVNRAQEAESTAENKSLVARVETPPDLVLPPETAKAAPSSVSSNGPKPIERESRSPFEIDMTPAKPEDPPATNQGSRADNAPPTPPPVDPALSGPLDADPPAESPPVSKEDILRDIQREADQVQADRNDREQLKPQAKARMLNENKVRIESTRLQFRKDLREVLKTYGNKAGPEIDRLCDQYGREVPEEIQERYVRAKRSFPPNLTRRAEIDRMRALGLPEPVLFDFLAHKIDKTMNSPKGPRNQFEVMVRAAQQLLSYPLPSSPRANPGPATGT